MVLSCPLAEVWIETVTGKNGKRGSMRKQKQLSSWRAKPQEQQGSHCLKAEEEVAGRFKRMARAGTRGVAKKGSGTEAEDRSIDE